MVDKSQHTDTNGDIMNKEKIVYKKVSELKLNEKNPRKNDGAEECLAYTHERVIEGKGELLINLYETQEQAEWHLKYHATRTEELNLPMWNEFITYNENIGVSFVGEDWVVYELSNDIDIYHKPRILLTADGEYFKEWKSTEENYEKACDLCLKLFKVEEE